jgi:hypothetical protein
MGQSPSAYSRRYHPRRFVDHQSTPESKAYGQPDHVRYYGRDYQDQLKAAGFEILVLKKEETVPPDLLAKLSVAPKTEIWICLKINRA